MASVIDSLKREHRAIECVLRALRLINERLGLGEDPDPDLLDRCIEFIRRFADGIHHQKEENILFPALAQAGMPVEMGPIACMLSEHRQGREYVAAMAEAVAGMRAGRTGASDQFRLAAEGYAQLLAGHIQKEDNVLFMMAERILGSESLSALQPDFVRAETDYGSGRYREFEVWARGLEQELAGRSVAAV